MRPARRGLLALATALVVGLPSTAHADPAWPSALGDRSGETGSAGGTARKEKPAESNALITRSAGRTASAVSPAVKPQPSPSAGKGGRSPWGPWPAARPGAARVVKETWLGPRMLDLQISSPAVNATLPVRVLVPQGWSKGARRTWPVLYLLVSLAHAQQDGDRPRQPYRADELHGPQDRQRGADENDVGPQRPGLQESLGTVGDARDPHPFAFQGRGQVMDHGRLRIGHQQYGCRPSVPFHFWCRLRLEHPDPPMWISRSDR
ncbi:hypothetical protein ABZ260_38695 [Streptosporangium sp. NPDC006013]|uniref:hypothetical protein n=1 Tax=Streptosporangium sp. NPDC006013 TaxID=3155596 RepID=UPI0033BBF92C